MTRVICKRPLKEKIKRYRALLILAIGLIFNLLESLYFGNTQGTSFNMLPSGVGEWICDIIALLIMFFALLLGGYDINKYAPQRVIVCSREDLDYLIKDHAEEAE